MIGQRDFFDEHFLEKRLLDVNKFFFQSFLQLVENIRQSQGLVVEQAKVDRHLPNYLPVHIQRPR